MKTRIKFYKHYFKPLRLNNFIPKFRYSKNVQGWFFIRNFIIEWFLYAISYSIMIISDTNLDRNLAHDLNVKKYMMK